MSSPGKIPNTSSPATSGKFGEMSKNLGIIVLILVVLLVIVLILVFIFRVVARSGMKKVELNNEVVSLENRGAMPLIIDAKGLGTITRGQEFTISFWLYLQDVYEQTLQHKLLFTRGNPSRTYETIDNVSNPVIMLDKDTNKLHVAVATNKVSNAIIPLTAITAGTAGYVVGTVDYVPLQRWIHFGIVIKDSSLTIYMDGELYSVSTTADISFEGQRPITKGSDGVILIGNPVNPIKGFAGRVHYFNYALSTKELTQLYRAGPVTKSALQYMGLGNVGVRSPFYTIRSDEM